MKKIFFIILLFILMLSSCWNENSSNISLNNSKQIVALWDSLTIWYALPIDDSYPSQLESVLAENNYIYEIINWWISGNTSENLLNRLYDYDHIKADIYLLNIWANDWLNRLDLDDMGKNIGKIINYIKKVNPNWKIILFWTELPINFWVNYSFDFKSRFEDIAKNYDVSYFWFFLDWVYWDSKLNLDDNMHPNKKWYEVISNNIFNYLLENNFLDK